MSVAAEAPIRADPAIVGAHIAGGFADASGHSAQSHLVYAANAGVWWLFTLMSTADAAGGSAHIVKAYHSSSADLAAATWIAAGDSPGAATSASSNCVSCFMGGGRALGVAYVNAAGADVVHAEVAMAADGQNGLTAHIRATVTATAIAWAGWNYHDEPAATWTVPRSVTLGASTGGYIHSAGPTLQQEVDANVRRSIDAEVGGAWSGAFTPVSVIDNSMLHANNAFAFAALPADVMIAVYDNGGGSEPQLTNLRYKRSNADGTWSGVVVGSQSGGDGTVFPTNAAIDQNDWTLVPISTADVFAFRSNAAASGVDAAVYSLAANTWSAFPAPPLFATGQPFKRGAGLFGATDGASIWLFAVSADTANTVVVSRHDAAGWTPWMAVPGTASGTHDRRYIAGYPRVSANQIGVIWTEGAAEYDIFATALVATDTAAPNVSLTAPADGSTVFGAVTVEATASDNVGIAAVVFEIDGVAEGPAQSAPPYALTWESTAVANGTHTIAAVSTDTAGNAGRATVSVVVANQPDTTAPAIANVAVFSVTATSASISWTTDERATSRVDYGASSTYGASAADVALTTAHTVALSGLASGATYHYAVSSADASANTAVSADATFTTLTADTTAPSVSVTVPTNGATVSGTVILSAAATDDTRVADVQFVLDGANLGAPVAASPYTTSWTTTTAANAVHALSARARDAAGNQATSAAISITVANVTPPAIDAVVFADQANTRQLRTGKFATSAANELLLAFVSAGDSAAGNTVTAVTGAGLAWSLVRRTNAQRGTAEIWRAFAASPLVGASVDVQFAQQAGASVTIVSFSRVDPSGAGGAGAIGATASASAPSGAPTATLVTTRNNSLVFGVGSDWTAARARAVGPAQTLLHQFLSGGKTLWVQRTTNPVALSGTTAVVNDTSPTTDRFNLTICEVLGRLQ